MELSPIRSLDQLVRLRKACESEGLGNLETFRVKGFKPKRSTPPSKELIRTTYIGLNKA